jgi:hypothetical protein
LVRAVGAAWNFTCGLRFPPQIEAKCRTSAVAEKNEEIIALIGRRLREAAEASLESKLPESVQLGLQRLSRIEVDARASRDATHFRHQSEQEAAASAAAQPPPE